jgi:hypothetical protein
LRGGRNNVVRAHDEFAFEIAGMEGIAVLSGTASRIVFERVEQG